MEYVLKGQNFAGLTWQNEDEQEYQPRHLYEVEIDAWMIEHVTQNVLYTQTGVNRNVVLLIASRLLSAHQLPSPSSLISPHREELKVRHFDSPRQQSQRHIFPDRRTLLLLVSQAELPLL